MSCPVQYLTGDGPSFGTKLGSAFGPAISTPGQVGPLLGRFYAAERTGDPKLSEVRGQPRRGEEEERDQRRPSPP